MLSGDKVALDRVPELGKAHGVRRAVPLPVSAPFHCTLMQPAADAMREALAKVTSTRRSCPLIANVLAQPITDPEEIKKRLVEQVTGTVRWRECVTYMTANGVTDSTRSAPARSSRASPSVSTPALNATSIGTPAVRRRRARASQQLEDIYVRPRRQDRARHRRHGRHRRRHRPGAARQGATVAVSGRQADKLEALAKELGDRVHVLPCDLADRAQVAKLIDAGVAKLGRLDILVNNAGLTRDNLFMVMKDEQWDEVIAVNLTSTFMLCRAAARAMLRAKPNFGRIINIASVSACSATRGRATTPPPRPA